MIEKEKISVFGASGFIGSNFCSKYPEICIPMSREDIIPKSKNILYLISTVDNYNVKTNPYLDIQTNLLKLIDVLEECRKLNIEKDITFNFVSSWFVYGKIKNIPAKEEDLCNPCGFYSITKFAAEKLLISYCETYNINYRIFRLSNIIGHGDKKISKKKNALQFMINRILKNELIELYDNGLIIRDYMHIDDCCRALKICLDNGENDTIYNISNSCPAKLKNIIDYVIQKTNSKSNVNFITTPQFHKTVQVEHMWLDNSKLLSIGYQPSMSVYEAIDKILEQT